MHLSLGVVLTLSAVESNKETYGTVYIENGTTSVQLPCGEVPPSALGIKWFAKKHNGWFLLLRFYHNISGRFDYFRNAAKYDISESVNTSLVVKRMKLSDSILYKCAFLEPPTPYRYTMLQVVGKSLQTNLFTAFVFVFINICHSRFN